MKRLRSILMFMMIPVLLLSGCGANREHMTKTALYYDTAVTIDLYGPDEASLRSAMDECINLCAHYERLFNKNDKNSDIALINSSKEQGVQVDHDTAQLIQKSLKYCDLSDGLFDITVKPVSDLWDFHSDNPKIPSQTEIENARALIDYKNISVDTNSDTVYISGNSSIDPGGAAKGYIADLIASYLHGTDITGAIINIGGDMRIVGEKEKGKPFTVGIKDPFEKNGVILPLMLADCAVATSGTYERCFTAGGKRYHHIIDPSTGCPADTDIESVTVICPDALSADCLCTICILLGSRSGMNLINRTENTEAVFVLSDGTVLSSDNAYRFIRQ